MKKLILLKKCEDWTTDIKLSKEFETLGFYISDHPLNQYKSIFSNIILLILKILKIIEIF